MSERVFFASSLPDRPANLVGQKNNQPSDTGCIRGKIKTIKNFNDMTFRAFMAENGYNVQTTFGEDFSAADIFGLSAIQDTFNRCL